MKINPLYSYLRFISQSLIALSFCLLTFSCTAPGNKPWVAHVISDGGSIESGNSGPVVAMELLDLDRDGSQELLVSRQDSEWISLYSFNKNPEGSVIWSEVKIKAVFGIQKFHIWQAGTRAAAEYFLIAATGLPTNQVLSMPLPDDMVIQNPDNWVFEPLPVPTGDWTAVHSSDFNNDGVNDLALAGSAGEAETSSAPEIIWMSQPDTTERTVITVGESAAPLLLYGDDIDGDGDQDLLVTDSAQGANSMGAYWLENPWPENPAVLWKRNFITLSSLKPLGATVVDFDRDKRQDLLLCLQEASGTSRLICFNRLTASTEVAWLPLPLPISGRQGKLVHSQMGDIDQDGYADLVLGFTNAASPLQHLLWMRNPTPSASSPAWIRRALSGDDGISTAGFLLYDIDQDKDLDVISADGNGTLRWYENSVPAVVADTPATDDHS